MPPSWPPVRLWPSQRGVFACGVEARAFLYPFAGCDAPVAVEVGREVAVAEDDGARVLCLEPCEQACHGRALCRCAVVGGVSAAVDAAGVGYVDGVAVVSLDAVGDAPFVEQPVRRACGVDDIVVARVAPSVPSESRHDALDCLTAVSCGAVHDEHGDGAGVCGVSLCHGIFFRFVSLCPVRN